MFGDDGMMKVKALAMHLEAMVTSATAPRLRSIDGHIVGTYISIHIGSVTRAKKKDLSDGFGEKVTAEGTVTHYDLQAKTMHMT